jgi:hypothetical protein
MVLPADYRAHCITIAAALLADKICALDLPAQSNATISSLIEQIRNDAGALRDELAPRGMEQRAFYGENVIPLRRR